MSGFAQRVKRYYELNLWSEARVRDAVEKGAVTAEEYLEITGKEYVEQ